MTSNDPAGSRNAALTLLFIAPALFASNMLIARLTAPDIPPIALAFWRWFVTFLLVLPFTGPTLWRERAVLKKEWLDISILGGLGMGVCGAFVYIGADTTTATNIGLIYAASPILILLGACTWFGEVLRPIQVLGVIFCLAGVLVILTQGDPDILLGLHFGQGDLWILASTVSWAVYSVLLRHRASGLSLSCRFAACILAGVVILLPFTIWEGFTSGPPAVNSYTLTAVGFLAIVASFGAYQVYAFIQRHLGAGPTSLLMYLVPVYNGALAYYLLDERLAWYQVIGAALVLPGIFFATYKFGPPADQPRKAKQGNSDGK
ncbi:MAG: DMT family transporter [Pseudomonadota bacterium]